jgi:hypothetical protein
MLLQCVDFAVCRELCPNTRATPSPLPEHVPSWHISSERQSYATDELAAQPVLSVYELEHDSATEQHEEGSEVSTHKPTAENAGPRLQLMRQSSARTHTACICRHRHDHAPLEALKMELQMVRTP